MAEGNDPVMTEVMHLLEAEPSSSPSQVIVRGIPVLREQLAILVSQSHQSTADTQAGEALERQRR